MKPLLAAAALLIGCAPSHPCDTALSKGPWVQRVDETHATILWESSVNGCVEAAVQPEDKSTKEIVTVGASTETHTVSSWGVAMVLQPDVPGTYYRNEVALTDLAPSTCYSYRINSSTGPLAGNQKGRFCTMRKPGDDVTWWAVGDTDPILGHTVPVMKYTLADPVDFVVHLGDMQYYTTASETWTYWFPVMAPMLRAGALFPTVGNHENENNGLEFDDYYGRLFVPASLDATTLWYHYSSGGIYFFSLDTEETIDNGSDQVNWLGPQLAMAQQQPGFRFSVVYMHRPLYTLGDSSPEVMMRYVLEPLFTATGVKLVLAGHMHGYERFEVPNGITYVTCAGGGGVIGNVNENVPNYPNDAPLRVVASDHYSACRYSVTAGNLHSVVMDEFGATIDQFDKAVP